MKNNKILNPVKIAFALAFVTILSVLNGCLKTDHSFSADKTFNISLSTNNVIPAVTGRIETGTAILILRSDYILEWSIQINDLSGQDTLTTAQINLGDPVTRGDLLIILVDNNEEKFVGGFANGSRVITPSEVAKINAGNVYISINSNQKPGGLLRGPIGNIIIWALDVNLSPENELPSITDRADRGIALLRFTDDNILYSNIQLMNVLNTDTITTANIEEGASGALGGSMVLLANSKTDFGISKKIKLTPDMIMHLMSDVHHVNVHSTLKPLGLMCGQLK